MEDLAPLTCGGAASNPIGAGSRLCLAVVSNDYPLYSTVYYYFRKWRNDGTWKRIHDHLVQWVRVDTKRDGSPTTASLDSQMVPTAVMVHQAVGYDGGKNIKGLKRFTLVDTLGLLIVVHVVAASVPEREGSKAFIHIAMIRLMLRRLA